MKKCMKCGIIKSKFEFHKNKTKKEGLNIWCKSCVKEYDKNNYLTNIEEKKRVRKEYYLKNRKERIKYQYKIKKERLKLDPIFKLIENFRHRVYVIVKNSYKLNNSIELLGCTGNELKNHLESKFTEGMNWENQGKWHIDHIIPCSSFDMAKLEEQKKCFHYTNLQPLWAIDNIKKSNNIIKIKEQ
jgi:hypothetical protein